jgi:simple sugar transport system permease protein
MLAFLMLVVTVSAPLIYATMAGYASERSGVINIGLEGKMLFASFLCAAISPRMGAIPGLLAAIMGATVLSIIHWVLTQKFRMDSIISGMAINLFAAGSSSFLKFQFTTGQIMRDDQKIPLNLFYITALLAPLALYWVANRTRFGVRLRSSGSDPDRTRMAGINPERVRFLSLLLTGLGCGIAGALLASETNQFSDNMTAGRGFIALAALILGGWRPIQSGLACLAFGAATAVQIKMTGQTVGGIEIPSEAWKSLPYLVTIIALSGFVGKSKAPSGLGKL